MLYPHFCVSKDSVTMEQILGSEAGVGHLNDFSVSKRQEHALVIPSHPPQISITNNYPAELVFINFLQNPDSCSPNIIILHLQLPKYKAQR